jgi:hypothetical protein
MFLRITRLIPAPVIAPCSKLHSLHRRFASKKTSSQQQVNLLTLCLPALLFNSTRMCSYRGLTLVCSGCAVRRLMSGPLKVGVSQNYHHPPPFWASHHVLARCMRCIAPALHTSTGNTSIAAQQDGLRSRAAYKLMHLDDKCTLTTASQHPLRAASCSHSSLLGIIFSVEGKSLSTWAPHLAVGPSSLPSAWLRLQTVASSASTCFQVTVMCAHTNILAYTW